VDLIAGEDQHAASWIEITGQQGPAATLFNQSS
jgi:hypothetical protein